MPEVVGIGAGGHAKVIIEILRAAGEHEIVGLVDVNRSLWGTGLLGTEVLGGDELLEELYKGGLRHAFIAIGSVGDTTLRENIYRQVSSLGFEIINAIHPSAVVSPSAESGPGLTVMANVVVNAEAHIGADVLINTGAIVEHDCVIGDHAHIAPGARLGGGVKVGVGSHVGMGATVRQGIKIGCRSVVGAGAVVVHDVPDGTTVVGVPARKLREASK